MDTYWQKKPPAHASPDMPRSLPMDADFHPESFISEFDQHQHMLITQGPNEEWQLELWQYLQDMPSDVT